MQKKMHHQHPAVEPSMTTGEAASALHLQPQTLRKAYSAQGTYFGVRPRKAANGRLLWPAKEIHGLTVGA